MGNGGRRDEKAAGNAPPSAPSPRGINPMNRPPRWLGARRYNGRGKAGGRDCRPYCWLCPILKGSSNMAQPDRRVFDVLVCPVCKGKLVYDEDKQELQCKASKLAFPIKDGVPVMLEKEARTMEDRECA